MTAQRTKSFSTMSRRAFLPMLPALAAHAAFAQAYPTSAVKIVVPFPAGSSADQIGRLYAQKLSELLTAPTIVDTRVGAGTTIGAGFVAAAKPDGYTLLAGSNSALTVAPSVFAKVNYNAEKDFHLIGPMTVVNSVLMAAKDTPFNNFDEFLKHARANPNTVAYGSYGIGTVPHLMMEMLVRKAKVDLIHVPYKGGVEVGQALAAKQIAVGFDAIPTAIARWQGGLVKPIVVFADKRSSLMPDVPCTAELGLGDVNILGVIALLSPAGVPADVLKKLTDAHAAILKDTDYVSRLQKMGAEAPDMSAEQLATRFRDESRKVKEIVQLAGIKPQ